MLLRVVQLMVTSPSGISLPLQRWKPPCLPFGSSFSKQSTSKVAPFLFPMASSSSHGCTCVRSFRLSVARSESNSHTDVSASTSPSVVQPVKVSFCQWCGAATKQAIPDGDEKPRAVCTSCGKITYQNPKMVTGCLVEHDDKILLCKRNIRPSYGLWTLPAGYMEIGESAIEGATRETLEEACAEVEIMSPFVQLDIPLIGQTYIIFRARLKTPHFSPGPESMECRLFPLEEIPFDSLAFSSMLVTLNLYVEDVKAGKLKFHYGTINKRPGTGPSDIRSYTLDDHFCC